MLRTATAAFTAQVSGRCGVAAPCLPPRSLLCRPGTRVQRRLCSSVHAEKPRRLVVSLAYGSGDGNGAGKGGSSGGGGGGSGGSSGDGNDGHLMRPWTYAFAALLAAGGAFAYFKAGSVKSLTSSCSAALILALCARSMAGATALNSARVAFVVCAALALVMGRRFSNTKKLMPAGLLAGCSVFMSVGFLGAGL